MKPYVSWAAVISVSALLCACGRTTILHLQPERQATLHVGELATIELPADAHYTIGSAGDSLVLQKRDQRQGTTNYLYRAVDVGAYTIVATPAEPGPSHCVSCVTIHYFVKVELALRRRRRPTGND
jgi:hypothetical protein